MKLFVVGLGLLAALAYGGDEENVKDIQFKAPDLVVNFPMDSGSRQRKMWTCNLEAYTVRKNGQSKSMLWASIGCPIILKHENDTIFHYTPEDVTVTLRTLAFDQKDRLLQEAKNQNNNDGRIKYESFMPIPLEQFTCKISFNSEGRNFDMTEASGPLTLIRSRSDSHCPWVAKKGSRLKNA
jgi:hypothetical protein